MRPLTLILALAGMTGLGGDLQAQGTPTGDVVDELRTMVAGQAQPDGDREAIRGFLDRADVERAATAHGLDAERLRAGVATLDTDAAQELARQARTVEEDQDQVGGNTIVISSTAIIIALLVLILLQV